MQQIGVDREGRLAALVLGHGDLVLLGEVDQIAARLELPFPPGRDHLDVGVERIISELEAHLVVALAGGAMGDGVGAGRARDLDLALGDQRPGDRGAEQIDAFIERVRPEHGEDEVAHELLAQILDEDLLDAEQLRLLARGRQFLALAEIGGEGHDLAGVGLLQPFEDDGGVEPARIGEHHLLDVFAFGHEGRLAGERSRIIGRDAARASAANGLRPVRLNAELKIETRVARPYMQPAMNLK